jgi:hypothetical protein
MVWENRRGAHLAEHALGDDSIPTSFAEQVDTEDNEEAA